MCMNMYLYENDFGEDSLRWIKKIEENNLNYIVKNNLTSKIKELDSFQEEIIKNNDTAFAYFFAMEFPYKQYKMQKLILDNKDPKYAFLFAQNIKLSDTKALQNLVVESKKIKYICKFACFVKNAEINQLETLILKSKNVKYAHMFLKYVKTSNVEKFKNLILSSEKPRYLFELSKRLTDPKDISLIEDLIIKSNSFTYLRLFAEKNKMANIDKIEQYILSTDNVDEIKKFAKYVRKSSMRHFLLVL